MAYIAVLVPGTSVIQPPRTLHYLHTCMDYVDVLHLLYTFTVTDSQYPHIFPGETVLLW